MGTWKDFACSQRGRQGWSPTYLHLAMTASSWRGGGASAPSQGPGSALGRVSLPCRSGRFSSRSSWKDAADPTPFLGERNSISLREEYVRSLVSEQQVATILA